MRITISALLPKNGMKSHIEYKFTGPGMYEFIPNHGSGSSSGTVQLGWCNTEDDAKINMDEIALEYGDVMATTGIVRKVKS